MRARTIVGALGLALVLVLLPATIAGAEFRGTDMWANLTPGGHHGGLADRYPISFYALDYHVDGPSVGFGGASAGDIPALVAQLIAWLLFLIFTFFMRVTISAFNWAFNVDIIGGPHGALVPVGAATKHLYTSTFGPLLPSAFIIFGAWLVYKIGGRKFGEAGVGGVKVICLTAIALVIIANPAATIGKASSLTNEMAGAIASGSTGGNGGQDVSDRIFTTFIYQPWAVLEFGGLKRCTSVEKDADGFPRYVNGESAHNVCRDTLTRYAPAFLRAAPGSSERKDLYGKIKDGEAPYDKADAPAVDMMQAGGAGQRIVFTVILCIGIVAAILLLGLICVAALFAQLGLLMLFAATPIMVVAAIFPGAHGIVFAWAKWIGKFLFAKVVYALMLSIALGVSAACMALGGTSQFGYLFAFGLQAALFGGIFIKRKALSEMLTSRRDYHKAEGNTKSFAFGAASAAVGAASVPFAAAGAAGAWGKQRIAGQQQPAPKPDEPRDSQPNTPVTTSSDQPSTGRKLPPDSSSPPASAGREFSPNPQPHSEPVPSESADRGDPVPTKSFREDYETARAEAAKAPAMREDLVREKPKSVHAGATAASFAATLEQERAGTPDK